MIPLKLTLKNFFSYQTTCLDFRGLHVACVSGSNGSGKSSLLEAITWALWSESRAKAKDDVILAGANDVRVDFEFSLNNQTYRVIRTHERRQSGSLEFQIMTDDGQIKSLTGKGIKDTQELINNELRLDYDTFINSAYLRQGRADEFMLRKPNERKDVLAKILKLDEYDLFAEKSQAQSRILKIEVSQIEKRLSDIEQELAHQSTLKEQKIIVEKKINLAKENYQTAQAQLQEIQTQQSNRQFWVDQIRQMEEQQKNAQQDLQYYKNEQNNLNIQLRKRETIIASELEILDNYQRLRQLKQEDEDLKNKFENYQLKEKNKQELEKNINLEINRLNNEIFKQKTELELIQKQEKEIESIIGDTNAIENGYKQLCENRIALQKLDKIQSEITPLNNQKSKIENDIELNKVTLLAELEQIKNTANILSLELGKKAEVLEELSFIDQQLDLLDKKKIYLERIEEKSNQKKLLKQELEQKQQNLKQEIEKANQKLSLLDQPGAICPICQSSLEEDHRQIVIEQMNQQIENTQQNLWDSYEQAKVCEKELNQLLTQLTQVKGEIRASAELQHKLSQQEMVLDDLAKKEVRLKNELNPKIVEIEEQLKYQNFALNLRKNLEDIVYKLNQFNYNEQTHSLLRTQVDRLRYFESKKDRLEEANIKQNTIIKSKPIILDNIASLEQELIDLNQNSSLRQAILKLEQEIKDLNYNIEYHRSVLGQIKQFNDAEIRYQQLQECKEELPILNNSIQQKNELIQSKENDLQNRFKQIEQVKVKIQEFRDYSQEIEKLKAELGTIQATIDSLNQEQGSLQQQEQRLEILSIEKLNKSELLAKSRHQNRIYEELAKAFGTNGIQSIMIENLLPNLEQETNNILSRLTQNQLHVSFITQKNASSGSRKNRETKTIDTLDILIADNNTTRPYEGYSGGEAFRVNFAIRLALSRILAQRAGTSLQMLIIDEGFGTQDAEGCERLIAAINAIADNFTCILAVTHMPQFKEAFQQRIEVKKSSQGSQIYLVN